MSLKWQINLLLVAQFIIIACLDMTDPFWPLIIHNFNQMISNQGLQYWSAAIYITPFLITIITTPMWGHLGAKVGYKKMLLRACSALVLTQLLVGFVTNPFWILGIRLIQGIFAGFTAAAQAWLVSTPDSFSHSQLVGRTQAATAMGSIVGPVFGGLIANYCGFHAIFIISGLICGLVILALAKYLTESCQKTIIKSAIQVSKLFQMNKSVFYLLFLICFTQAAKWMSSSYFALYVLDRLHGTNLSAGILYACIALTIFLSASHWGKLIDKMQRGYAVQRVFIATLLVAALTQCSFAFSTSFSLAFISSLLLGVCLAAISLIPFVLLIKEADENKGTLIGFGNSASKLGNLLGVALGAVIQAKTNFTISFIAIALVYVSLGALLILSKTKLAPTHTDMATDVMA